MAYGLEIFSPLDSVNPIFSSEDAFGFIELGSENVDATGSAGSTFSITLDDGYTEIYYIYSPNFIRSTNLTDGNTRFPRFDIGTPVDNGNGTKTFSLTVSWGGTGTGANRIGGGRVLIFGR